MSRTLRFLALASLAPSVALAQQIDREPDVRTTARFDAYRYQGQELSAIALPVTSAPIGHAPRRTPRQLDRLAQAGVRARLRDRWQQYESDRSNAR